MAMALMLLVAGTVWLGTAESTIRVAHSAACPPGSPADLQWLTGGSGPDAVAQVVTGWYTYSQEVAAGPQAEPTRPDGCAPLQGIRTQEGDANLRLGKAMAEHWSQIDIVLFVPAYVLTVFLLITFAARNPRYEDRRTGLLWLVQRIARWPGRRARVSWLWPVLLLGGAMADEAENLTMIRRIDDWWTRLAQTKVLRLTSADLRPIHLFGMVKWALLAAPMAVAVAVGIHLAWRLLVHLRRALAEAWVQIGVSVVFVAMAWLAQGSDAVRRLSVAQWIVTLVVLTVFVVVVVLTAAGRLKPHDIPPAKPPQRRADYVLPGVVVMAAAAVLFGVARLTGWHGVDALAALVAAIGVVSLALDLGEYLGRHDLAARAAAGRVDPTRENPYVARTAAILGGVVVGGLGLVTIRATVPALVVLHDDAGNRWRATLGLVLAVLAGPVVFAARALVRRTAAISVGVQRAVLGTLTVAAVGTGWLLYHPGSVQRVAPALGTLNVLAVFLGSFCLLGSLAAHASNLVRQGVPNGDRIAVASALRLVGFRRTQSPVIFVLALWAVLATSVDYTGYYAIRVVDRDVATGSLLTPEQSIDAWLGRGPDEATRPLLVVAASGGGIRAAYWTAMVMSCVVEMDIAGNDPCALPASPAVVARRRQALLAASGASGGSLGLTSYVAQVGANWAERPRPLGLDWVDRHLGGDFLAPTLSTYLFTDMLASFLRPATGEDRAGTLEQAWERASDGAMAQPFFAAQLSGREPYLLLNGTNVADGCRILTSPIRTQQDTDAVMCTRAGDRATAVDAAPSTIDLRNQLCPTCDISYATAALNSARFPLITPAGRVLGQAGASPIDVVDGGYRDNSGASTLVDLWPEWQATLSARHATVRPIFLQIDNGYSAADLHPRPPINLNQLTAPLTAQLSLEHGIESAARQQSQHLFDGVCGDTRYVRITTLPHPGISAPLGWVLSSQAAADLRSQLRINLRAILAVRRALDGTGGCSG